MGLLLAKSKIQEVEFFNEPQREFYYANARNQCFSGGFNNGKSFMGCLKAYSLLSTFPYYRFAICRQVRADLMKTTYQTFFKICPYDFIAHQNLQEGITIFKNGSRVDWLHMDNIEDSTLRGLEINSYLWDQAEEGEEKVFDILDARMGRWDEAIIPQELLQANPNWPKNPKSGKYIAPSYGMLLVNPDSQFHYIYRNFHPDSIERNPKFFYVEGRWDKNMGSEETYENALRKDQEWKDKYIEGKWGISNAQIHRVWPESYLDYTPDLIDEIRRKGKLFRILDHGETAPTCCLWCAVLNGNFIFYREYYTPNQVISFHRQAISDLSQGEYYSGDYADPQIFKRTGQKDGAYWTTAMEYMDKELDAPPIVWLAADNNEFATRNRINELLKPQPGTRHPGLKDKDGKVVIGDYPRIYFIRKSEGWSHGCAHVIKQLGSQKRKLIGYDMGKAIYSDDREESIDDHAYDCVRYMVAAHARGFASAKKIVPKNSFEYYKKLHKNKGGRLAPA